MEAYQRQKKKKEETNTPKNPLTEEKAMNQSMYFISHTVWSEPNGKQKWVQKNQAYYLSLFETETHYEKIQADDIGIYSP